MIAIRCFAVAALAAVLTACALRSGGPAQWVAPGSRLTVADPLAGTPMQFQGGRRVATVDRWQRPYCILRGTAAPEYRVTGFRLETVPTGRVVTRFIDANAQRMFGGEIVEYRSRLNLWAYSGGVASLTCATREEATFGRYLSREEIRGILGGAATLSPGRGSR